MNEEYILPQSAAEVVKAIGKALTSVQTINGLTPDENGSLTLEIPPEGGGTITEEQIAQAVAAYLKDHPVQTGSPASIGIVSLPAANWVSNDANLHAQVVDIDGVTENSQVDLTPSVEQLVVFYEKDLTFVTENDGGVVTVYAIGQKPEHDYTIQVTITEVNV